MSTQSLYRTTLARMGARPDDSYYNLPSYWRGLADAAAEAQSAFWAASLAASNARAAGAWGASEALDAAEMDTYATWQRLERIGAEHLDAHAADSTLTTPALASAQGVIGGHPMVIVIGPILFALCGVGILGALGGLGIALARIAAAADTRRAFLSLDRAAHRAERAPDRRPLSDAEIRARVLADQWFREDRLTVAGYHALCNLMYRGEDARPYMSGGPSGAAVVWAHGRRYSVEEWNASADREAAQLDAEMAPLVDGGAAC